MTLIISADDFGNSPHMSGIILKCFQEGSLGSTSVMVTAPDAEHSLAQLLPRANIRTSLHLNIAEGRPISSLDEVPYLVDSQGEFCKGYARIVRDYYLGNHHQKAMIRRQIKHEFTLQIHRYVQMLQTNAINIDSHQHYHTIPFVVDILLELSMELTVDIRYVRIPDEPFFLEVSNMNDLKNYFGTNLVKHFLLNFMSRGMKRKLDQHRILHNDRFIGVLFTGNMTLNSIRKALSRVQQNQTVEILLHPASLSEAEALERKQDQFHAFYTHPNRKREEEILLSSAFKALLLPPIE